MFDVEKIIGNKKNKDKTKFTDMSLSGTFGKNPFSDMVGKLTDKPLRNFGVNNPIKMDGKSKNKLTSTEENRIDTLERMKESIISGMNDNDTTYNPTTARVLDRIDNELDLLYNKRNR